MKRPKKATVQQKALDRETLNKKGIKKSPLANKILENIEEIKEPVIEPIVDRDDGLLIPRRFPQSLELQ